MHQIDGISFSIFAERGLWNRFVPSLDGYIQDRLNNPIHLPNHGTLKTLRLEAPAVELVRRIVEARLRPALEKLPDFAELSPIFPFTERADRPSWPAPSRRCATCSSSSATCSIQVFGTGSLGKSDSATITGNKEHGGTANAAEYAVSRRNCRPASNRADRGDIRSQPPAPCACGKRARRNSPLGGLVGSRRCGGPGQNWSREGSSTGATRELQAGLGRVPANLSRTRRQSRAVAAEPRCPRMDVRRPSDLRRHHHRPLGVQGWPAVEGRHRPVPRPRSRKPKDLTIKM